MVELAPEAMMNDLARLRAKVSEGSNGMLLIGRRQLRSHNSTLHNHPL
jgi:hypothetical protein